MNRLSQALLVVALVSVSVLAEEPKSALAVYLPDYRVKAGTEPMVYGTTNLILFSARPKTDGTVDFSRIKPELLEFGKQARKQRGEGLTVTVCVGGWGRGKEFATAVSTEANRNRFVNGLVEFCSQHDLDGVDIDWEFPKGEEEHENLALFLEALSERLRADDRILTIALGYTRPLPATCWAYIDKVHLMSYQPWNVQPYEEWLEQSIERFLGSGLPPEKLVLGVGFFAKEKAGDRRAVSWKKIAGEATGKLPESKHGFWPVGKEACDLRLDLVKRFELGGVMVWDYGHDSAEEEYSLLRYLSEKMKP